ncbi:MAG: PSD1 domain-containing protein [Candidatus Hydrogenedentes bacterium]|nr:PSD1 domain-containing protein [Candidatus Hydrogenedentota bacterium]
MILKFPRGGRLAGGLLALGGHIWAAGAIATDPSQDALDFFETKVRPVLAERCFKCHGPETQKSGLRLDSRAAMLSGGEGGPVLLEGDKSAGSSLLAVIRYDGALKMPPDAKLPQDQIDAINAWVAMGSPWPGGGEIVAANKELTWEERTAAARASHWAYQPVSNVTPPAVASADAVRTPVDNFLLARLEEAGLGMSPVADRRTLIRRAYLDLIGLAPSMEEVRAFEADDAPDAFDRVIEHLLASPHYGERWGRHWLDIARYADTKGYVFQQERNFGFSHTYRDYVVRAFNEDLPYDTFLKHQIAADLMDLGEDRRPLAALGYVTLGRRFVGNIHDVTDDRIDVVTRGMLGLTVSCARCHDHKYDAISARDYYGLYGIFRSASEPAEPPLIEEPDPDDPEYQAYQKELQEKEADREALVDRLQIDLLKHGRDKAADYLLASHKAWDMADNHLKVVAKEHELKGDLLIRWRNHLKTLSEAHHPVLGPWFAYRALPAEEFAAKSTELAAQIAGKQLNGQAVNPLVAKRFEGEPPASVEEVTERYRGLIAEAVKAWSDILASHTQMTTTSPERALAAPDALPDANLEAVRQLLFATDSPSNIARGDVWPLSEVPQQNQVRDRDNAIARVKSTHPGRPNRAMALEETAPFDPYVFRRGQPGNRGDSVPRKFLDVLSPEGAAPYTEGSGRLEMAKAIATHENPLTARVMVNRIWMHHFGEPLVGTPSDFGARSDAPTHPELLDYLAGEFMAGGWSVKHMHRLVMRSAAYQQASLSRADGDAADPENRLLWRQNRQRRDFETMRDGVLLAAGRLDLQMGGEGVELTVAPFPVRRTIYGRIERQNLPDLFRTFDFASPDVHVPRRVNTTVPQQALFLMNSPFLREQASELARREMVAIRETPEERIAALYQAVFQRDPAPEEIELGRAFVASQETAPPEKFGNRRWQYGYGPVNAETGLLESFTPLPHFTGSAWQGGPNLPDPALDWVSLNSHGGHPGKPGLAAVRRWVAPFDATIALDGELKHGASQGDGVTGSVIARGGEVLWTGRAHNGTVWSEFENVNVKAGDTIDLVVDCGANQSHDSFTWHPRIRVVGDVEGDSSRPREWLSRLGFDGPAPEPMGPWEKYAQVLLMSNEFMFVD